MRGAKSLHIVDLDAALGMGDNFSSIMDIKDAFDGQMHVGGGIRSVKAANDMITSLGKNDRIIMGTLIANEYPGFESLEKISQAQRKVIASVDTKGGNVAIGGWKNDSGINACELMGSLSGLVWGFLYTNVDVEGKMGGVDKKAIEKMVSACCANIIVSGGITTADDISACEDAGAWGVVVGKAAYENVLDLEGVL